MASITITVRGNPVAQPRARVTRRNGRTFAYVTITHKIHAWRQQIADATEAQVANHLQRGWPMPDGKRGVRVTLHFSVARKKSNKSIMPGVRPDIDNYVKGALDAMSGIAWSDDGVVTTITASKRWATKNVGPGLVAIIRDDWLDEDND